jgi:hypothetical protein
MGNAESRVNIVSVSTLGCLKKIARGKPATAVPWRRPSDAGDVSWKVEAYSLNANGSPHIVSIRNDCHPQCPLDANMKTIDPGVWGLNGKANFPVSQRWEVEYAPAVLTDGKIDVKAAAFRNCDTRKYLACQHDSKDTGKLKLHMSDRPHQWFMKISKSAMSPSQVATVALVAPAAVAGAAVAGVPVGIATSVEAGLAAGVGAGVAAGVPAAAGVAGIGTSLLPGNRDKSSKTWFVDKV